MALIQLQKLRWEMMLLAFLLALVFGQEREQERERDALRPVDLVNPFMGTEGGGNMFPGVTHPFGMAKPGIDVIPPSGDPYSGYSPTGDVTGFSMMHVSGTGGAPKYGVVSQLPILGNVSNPLLNYGRPRPTGARDEAAVGWYKATVDGGVRVELAASKHAGIFRYEFPEGQMPNVLVDVSHLLPSFRGQGLEQRYVSGGIKIDADGYTGNGTYNNGWNRGEDWTIHFCGKFESQNSEAKTFAGTKETLDSFGRTAEVAGTNGKRVGALFTFSQGTAKAESKIGISFISTKNACDHIDKEIPKTDSFDTLVSRTKSAWNGVLSRITTTEADQTKLQMLYTAIYGMFLIPSDRTGENPLWNSDEPSYDDIITFWDTFRSHTPLFHILQPAHYTRFIRSLIDIWRNDDFLPDARSSNFNGRTQGGSNADNVLADAYVKGVRNGINWEDGYKALLTDAEKVPPNNNDPMAPDSSTAQGRGALPDWKDRGLITPKYTRAVSRAIEYSLNDFCISQVAKGLRNQADYEKYTNRSKNWRNHWDTRSNALGFSGFLSPVKDASGAFPDSPQNPLSCGGCYWGDAYYQGLPFEYSFNAHHDMQHLISLMGGDQKFIERLDILFTNNLFNPGNEPSFMSPWLYNFVPGNQWRTVDRVRAVSSQYYNTGVRGLPGNSDAGAMQSWLLWSLIGLYPVTGTTTFLIAAPQLDLKVAEVELVRKGSGQYVQSLKVNGESWNKGWVEWKDTFGREGGAKLEFEMGEGRVEWEKTGERPLWGVV